MAQDPYIVTTNPATDITETSAKLHGHVYFRAKMDDYGGDWHYSDDLTLYIRYTENLMADVSGVAEAQFELETDNGNVTPNSISKSGDNVLALVFIGYDQGLEELNKVLSYTQSVTEAERLQCAVKNADVVATDSITVVIPKVFPDRHHEETITIQGTEVMADFILILYEDGHHEETISVTGTEVMVDFLEAE